MGDLNELQSAQAVEITDEDGLAAAAINTSLPGASDAGLTVREARQGQTTMSASVPVAIASDQSPVQVVGNVDNDGVDSGNPVKIGGQARTTNPTAVADGDRSNVMTDKMGRVVTVSSHVRALVTKQRTQINSAAETTILTAGGAGVFHDLTLLAVSSDANNITVTIREATAGAIIFVFNLDAETRETMYFSPPLPQTTANNNWTAQVNSATAIVNILVQAVKNV